MELSPGLCTDSRALKALEGYLIVPTNDDHFVYQQLPSWLTDFFILFRLRKREHQVHGYASADIFRVLKNVYWYSKY